MTYRRWSAARRVAAGLRGLIGLGAVLAVTSGCSGIPPIDLPVAQLCALARSLCDIDPAGFPTAESREIAAVVAAELAEPVSEEESTSEAVADPRVLWLLEEAFAAHRTDLIEPLLRQSGRLGDRLVRICGEDGPPPATCGGALALAADIEVERLWREEIVPGLGTIDRRCGARPGCVPGVELTVRGRALGRVAVRLLRLTPEGAAAERALGGL